MRKIILILLPILIIGSFIFVLAGTPYFKKPFGQDDSVQKLLETVKENIQNGRWVEAQNNIGKLESAWNKVLNRIQLDAEKDDVDRFSITLTRLKGYVEVRDKKSALVELKELELHWNDVGT